MLLSSCAQAQHATASPWPGTSVFDPGLSVRQYLRSFLEVHVSLLKPIEVERLLFAGVFVALCGSACAAHDTAAQSAARMSKSAGSTVYNASRKGNGEAEAHVSLLARAFLPASSDVQPGFAYYAYLLFTDSSPNSAPARRAVSATYLGMLNHVHAANEKTGISREGMAVLYVPLVDQAPADSLMKDRDPQALLSAYNYVRARGMAARLKHAGKRIPDVAIIGSRRPLTVNTVVEANAIDVVDLTDPGTAAERMERFRDSLQAGERHLIQEGQPIVLTRVHEFFLWADATAHDVPRVLTF
jgi:hypothetical protein